MATGKDFIILFDTFLHKNTSAIHLLLRGMNVNNFKIKEKV
jgi:hypothetical protein